MSLITRKQRMDKIEKMCKDYGFHPVRWAGAPPAISFDVDYVSCSFCGHSLRSNSIVNVRKHFEKHRAKGDE